MANLQELKKYEQKLSGHVAAGHGKETASSLRDKSYDHASEAGMAHINNEYAESRRHTRASDHYDDLHSDVKSASKALKEYGQGHNMSHHGEGKPYKS